MHIEIIFFYFKCTFLFLKLRFQARCEFSFCLLRTIFQIDKIKTPDGFHHQESSRCQVLCYGRCSCKRFVFCRYDDKHEGTSRYRIDKMDSVEVEPESRVEKAEFMDFNPEKYRRQVISMFGGELKKVEIEFIKELLGDVYDKFGLDIKIQKLSEEKFKTTVEVQVSRTFFIWIVGTLGRVKILAPLNVKKQFDEINLKVDALYKQLHDLEDERLELIKRNGELELALKVAQYNICERPDDECIRRLPARQKCRLRMLLNGTYESEDAVDKEDDQSSS